MRSCNSHHINEETVLQRLFLLILMWLIFRKLKFIATHYYNFSLIPSSFYLLGLIEKCF